MMMPIYDAPPALEPPSLILRVQAVAQSLESLLAAKARQEGWSDSQAEWVGKLGAAEYAASGGQQRPSPELFEQLFKVGTRKLTIGYFNDALSRGKTRLVAFLTVLDLERQVKARRGEQVADYPDDWAKSAYVKVEEAAARGADSAEQIEAGLAEIRRQEASTGAATR